jgi:hypothetical protein
MSALLALEAHMEHHLAWLGGSATEIGMTQADEDEPTKDARARVNSQVEQLRALRRDLADLVADAEAVWPPGVPRDSDVIQAPELPALPSTVGPAELRVVEQSFARGIVLYAGRATLFLRALHERLSAFADEDCRALAERAQVFVGALNSERGRS